LSAKNIEEKTLRGRLVSAIWGDYNLEIAMLYHTVKLKLLVVAEEQKTELLYGK
jgi:hypothetical protein